MLDDLDRQDYRTQGVYGIARRYERQACRVPTVIRVQLSALKGQESTELVQLRVWSREVSAAGMSFIYSEQIRAESMLVGLGPGLPKDMRWFQAEVRRSREIQDGFWEYGVQFRERLTDIS